MEIKIIQKDQVLVEKIKWEHTTKSGIVIVESEFSEEEKLYKGRVVSIGPKVRSVKVGNEVCFTPFVGRKIQIEGKECFLMREENLDGVWS